MEKHDAHIESW